MQASLFRAFLIRARQELLAPLLATRSLAESLGTDAGRDTKWAGRFQRLQEACDASITMVEERCDLNHAISEAEQEQLLGTLRHDLNNPLTALSWERRVAVIGGATVAKRQADARARADQ